MNSSINPLLEATALEKQIKFIMATSFANNYIEKPNYYNFRCNICGDSKKSKKKRRGYILRTKNPWTYYCHNGCGSMSIYKWMREYFPLNYKAYLSEILGVKKEEPKNIKYHETYVSPKPKVKTEEYENVKHFVPILKGNGKLFQIARELCVQRMIPEEVWHKWYVATGGKYKNRLIIPFYDAGGKIYYYQGRALYKSMTLKYLSMEGEDKNSIYNYYLVDNTKPVIVLEGPIDALFVENSIAPTGMKFNDMLKSGKYFLIDSDPDAKKKAFKLLKNGEYVFIWKWFLRDLGLAGDKIKDINEVIVALKRKEKFTFEELKKYFTNNIYDKIHLL